MAKKEKRRLTDRLVRRVYYKYFARNLLYELQIRARDRSADYVESRMGAAVILERHGDVLRYAAEHAPKEGLCLEFGVATGNTLTILAEALARSQPGREVHGFDSFEGLPEDWAGHVERRGAFRRADLPKVPANAKLHVGLFDQTLPGFVDANPGPVALIHMDCDLYSSTKTVLDALADRIGPGTVILFDEYFNYPNWEQHEFRAWQEFVTARGLSYEYLAFGANEGRVVVRVT